MMATKTAAPPADPAEAAMLEVQRLHLAELELSDKRLTLAAALPAAEADAGVATLDRFLAGEGTVTAAGDQLQARQAELKALDAAIQEARERRKKAILAVFAAQARPLRVKAAELRAEADRRQPRTDDLLRQLEEHEECRYIVDPTRRPLSHLPRDPRSSQDARTYVGDRLADGPFRPPAVVDDPGLTVVYVTASRTQLLRNEAADLDRRAEALEQRAVPAAGQLLAETTAALLDQVRGLDAMVLGPPLPSVLEWASVAEAKQRGRLARLRPHHDNFGARLSLTLVWADGRVDAARSRALVPALDA